MNNSEEFCNIYMNFIEKFLASFCCDDKDAMTVMSKKKKLKIKND